MKIEPIEVKVRWIVDFQGLIEQLEHLTEVLKHAAIAQDEFNEAWFSKDERMKDEE